jgi:hypothetical protein
MKKQLFFVDAECDGLYGKFLSVAALVTDKNGTEVDSFYGAVKLTSKDISNEWVKENVYHSLGNAHIIFDSERDLLEAFWSFWLRHRENADCISYVPYPVESRLFIACVVADTVGRQFLAPFPLYDLATLLEAKGYHFDSNMKELSGLNLESHDAMNDVKMMAEVWKKFF